MIEGKKVYLKAVERKNLEQLRLWRNEEWLRKYFREYREITESMQKAWYENNVAQNDKFVNFEIWAKRTAADQIRIIKEFGAPAQPIRVTDNSRDSLIGMCGLYYINFVNRTSEFAIYIGDVRFSRMGYGSDALRTLLKYGFEEMNLHRIWCEVYDGNGAIELYKKLGFVQEGTLRQHTYSGGKYMDSHILGLLKEDWEKPKSDKQICHC